ncbi:MAG: AsmA family protein, partial [Tardiphaga sp.]|uniref:hypothetical protein n=1 Tax=Tardiphaga sp. TaxID=1926292 RepID=UPI0019993216
MTIPENRPLTARPPRWHWLQPRIALAILASLAIFALALGAFPVGMMRGLVENRLSAALKTHVQVGAITRDGVFSYTPIVSVRDVRIAQPAW